MNKRYQPFNYGVTWLGIIRVSLAVYCFVWIFRIINSSEPVLLKIFLILLTLVGIAACLIDGLPNLRDGIKKAKEHSQDYLYGRERSER